MHRYLQNYAPISDFHKLSIHKLSIANLFKHQIEMSTQKDSLKTGEEAGSRQLAPAISTPSTICISIIREHLSTYLFPDLAKNFILFVMHSLHFPMMAIQPNYT